MTVREAQSRQPRVGRTICSWLTLAGCIASAGLSSSCGDAGDDACGEYSGLESAQLRGEPAFSAPAVAAGDPLSLLIPVNADTRSAYVWIREINESWPRLTGAADTHGDEVVEMAVDTSSLPVGVYFVYQVSLEGVIAAHDAEYSARTSGQPYTLATFPSYDMRVECTTDVPAPSFAVVEPPLSPGPDALGAQPRETDGASTPPSR